MFPPAVRVGAQSDSLQQQLLPVFQGDACPRDFKQENLALVHRSGLVINWWHWWTCSLKGQMCRVLSFIPFGAQM